MKKFEVGGGGRPNFRYKIPVVKITTEMYEWCENQPGDEHFDRWYIEYGATHGKGHDVVTFEREQPAMWFALRWGGS